MIVPEKKSTMDFDTIDTDIWTEIADMPGEVWDIPELNDDEFDFDGYINGVIEY